MEIIEKTPEKMTFITGMNISLANAIRRSIGEIQILAFDELDIYKNDSALYDEIIAHRVGLVPIKNQKVKSGEFIEMKLKAKGKGEASEVLAGELGSDIVYPEMPIVLLGDGQAIEFVARARTGKGNDHARFTPGIIFYKHLPKIKIDGDGEKQISVAETYPETFEVNSGKLSVKDASKGNIDEDNLKSYPGIEVKFDDKLVLTIESWGQIEAKEIFTEACKALKANLSEVSKAIK